MLKNTKLEFDCEIGRWDEAIPLGNARLGALIWGGPARLRFSLDRADLWDLRQSDKVFSPLFNVKTLKQLVSEKENGAAEIKKIFESFYDEAWPTKIPAGAAEFVIGGGKISFSLDLSTAICTIAADRCRMTVFAGRNDGMLHIRCDGIVPEFGLCPPSYGEKSDDPHSLARLGYPKAVSKEEDDFIYFVQKTYEDRLYGVFAAVKRFENGTEYVLDVASGAGGCNELTKAAKAKLSEALSLPWEERVRLHKRWWKDYHSRCGVDLPDRKLQHYWNLYNYYFGCLADENCPPIALQGVWTADDGKLPPWKGDFHMDLNIEMSYWAYLRNNHFREGAAVVNYLKNTWPRARRFAKEFFGSGRGACLAGTCDLNGNPMGGWAQYSYTLTNQCWLCSMLGEYYEFTEDDALLKDFIYPYLEESAYCILDNCAEDGELLLPYSTSPEIHENKVEAWLEPNCNYDLALLKKHFTYLKRFAEKLGKDASLWEKTLSRLAPFYTDETGYMIDCRESLCESHRHFGHAMAIYPLEITDTRTERETVKRTLDRLEELGYDWWIGFSFSWMACLAARAGYGDLAEKHLNFFTDAVTSVNGFHLNGDFKRKGLTNFDYRPFTLEGNFAFNAAINEILLQERGGEVDFFPALPTSWKKSAAFHGFRARGNLEFSAALKDGRISVCAVNHSNREKRRTLVCGAGKIDAVLAPGKTEFVWKTELETI